MVKNYFKIPVLKLVIYLDKCCKYKSKEVRHHLLLLLQCTKEYVLPETQTNWVMAKNGPWKIYDKKADWCMFSRSDVLQQQTGTSLMALVPSVSAKTALRKGGCRKSFGVLLFWRRSEWSNTVFIYIWYLSVLFRFYICFCCYVLKDTEENSNWSY